MPCPSDPFRRNAMLYHGLVVMLAGLLAVSGAGAPSQELPEAAKKEIKALEGRWGVVKVVFFDRESIHDPDDRLIFAFKGNTIDFAKSGAGVIVELDSGTDPKCLDFKLLKGFGVLKKDATYESAYKIDGDTLTWAVHVGREKNRPLTFDTPADAGTLVIVLTRVKE
jgi:uncharacterized protein (TIGR03067 family)